jgi:peptidoglycan hydrolase-like protein with peptidoglycan-binding domain
MRRHPVVLAAALIAGSVCGEAKALAPLHVPGLQVALYRYGHYEGPIDGIHGPMTRQAVISFQRSAGLEPDGIPGERTRAAFGRLGRPLFGARMLRRGAIGFDVSVLQFLLSKHGFAPKSLNSNFGPVTEQRVREFQLSVGLEPDGIVGRQTRAALLGPRQSARHVVRPGETLSGIAARAGTTVEVLARSNGMDRRQLLIAGTELVVPLRDTARSR